MTTAILGELSNLPATSVSLNNRLEDERVERRADGILDGHPHFRGSDQWVQCRCSNRVLKLDGCLPSYFLKQLAQEALRDLEGISRIENRIAVSGWQRGPASSEPSSTHDRNAARKPR